MIRKIGKHLKKRKVKIFLVFLLVSSLAWFINKLSESYTSRATFVLTYDNVPEGYLLKSASKENLEVKLEASGFQFLGFGLTKKRIPIDLSTANKKGSKFTLTQKQIEKQIEKNLPNSMVLKDMDKGAVFFEFVNIITKKIPVIANIEMSLHKNCLLEGDIVLDPSTIEVTGPRNEIDTLKSIKTKKLKLKDVKKTFSLKVQIVELKALVNTSFSIKEIHVSGEVSRFSEKMIRNVPITVINLPENTQVKTFPNKVKVLCKAELGVLKTISRKSFTVVADYNAIKEGDENVILEVVNLPNEVYSASLQKKKVTYIVNRE